ncbi:sensor histidine kinase [Clostridium mediterraneense]|uniref:sensor histidine kinase n=1 Tax=Clostridium mediterraneense TaxID=1805472 RepID=UPI0008301BE5|nr:ATP-binding protein [Clostridium mediterraneense]
MKPLEYFKSHLIFIGIHILVLIFTSVLLKSLRVENYTIIFIVIVNFIGSTIFYIYDYFNKNKYYSELLYNLKALDKKYLISDIIEEANFLDGKILYKVIKETNKSMADEVANLNIKSEEYKEYIEMWVHEVKTPIAVCKLISENNESEVVDSISEEVEKIENYIEQALFYARSNEVEKDYIIKKMNIKSSVNKVIKRNMNSLLNNNIKIKLDNIDQEVYSDSKWLEFILNQIIINSIKYMKKGNKELKIYCDKNEENITLSICDNGIGMSEKDIAKAFEKGYTGDNGRKFIKSTGIGLYLCNKLCIKLGLRIKLDSKEGIGTKVSIIFPINKMITF